MSTPDNDWLSSQVPPSCPEEGCEFLVSSSAGTLAAHPPASFAPLTVILAKPNKNARARNEHPSENATAAQKPSRRQRSAKPVVHRKRRSTNPTQDKPISPSTHSASLLSTFLSQAFPNAPSFPTASSLSPTTSYVATSRKKEPTKCLPLASQPPLSVHALRQAMRVFSQQLDEMQKNRMIVFLEDYNNYRAFSRFVAWRSSSHPPLNDVLDLVMQHTSQWNADDTPNTIVCCGWTSRQTIHVLRLEDMRQTHPFLVNNLVTFTHWVNSLFSN